MDHVFPILQMFLDFLLDVVKHLLGTTDGVSLLALVAVAVIRTAGEKNKELEALVLKAFNITEKVMEVVSFPDDQAKMAAKTKRFLVEFSKAYQDQHGVSPTPSLVDKALVMVEKPVHERKSSKGLETLIKTLAALKGLK